MTKFQEMIEDACYGAIITWEGDETTIRNLAEYAYEEELVHEVRNSASREIRFMGKDAIIEAAIEYLKGYFEGTDIDEEFTVEQ